MKSLKLIRQPDLENRWLKEHTDALSLDGALLVADSCVVDGSDVYRIALKTIAHEYRKLRAQRRTGGQS